MKTIREIIQVVLVGGGIILSSDANAQTVIPWQDIPATFDVPTNAFSSSRPELPSPPGGFDTITIQSALNFIGLDDDTTRIPPDTHGAVGPNHVVTMLNSQVRISNRAGTTNYSTVTLSNFWGSSVGTTHPFDPRVVYDPYAQRWVATATADVPPLYGNTSSLLIGVSQTSDPTGAWYLHSIDVDPNNVVWADYPSMGFNRNWVVVQVNMFDIASPGAFNRSHFYVFNRTNLYAGGTNRTLITLTNFGSTQVPAVTFDTNQNTLYFLQSWNSRSTNTSGQVNGFLRLYTLTGNIGSETLTPTTNFPMAEPWSFSPGNADFAPQSNTTVKIMCNDARLQNVVYRNGSLWSAHTIFLPFANPTRSSVQWWQIRTNGIVQQTGRVDDSAGVNFYAFPSIGVNRFGDALVGFSSFSSNQYASASYVYRNYYDTINTVRAVTLLKAGEGRYYKTFGGNRNRWGDYSATMPDPVNDTDFWTVQEYAATPVGTGLTDGNGRWAVWWGNATVPVSPNDNFANYYAISGQQGTTNGTNLRGTKESGEPNHAGNASTVSTWYRWTAPTNGNVVIDTTGSDFDTVLAIYTGSSVGNLTLVTNDDNSGGGGASQVVFNATSGTTYSIAVDGSGGVVGNFVLNWIQPAKPVFTLNPQSKTVLVSSNVSFTSAAVGVPTPSYQWKKNGVSIGSATSSSYTLNNAQTGDAANYTVVASNTSGSVTSLVATLTVYPTATPTLDQAVVNGGEFRFRVTGVPSFNYVVQANTNLGETNWVALGTNASPFTFTNVISTNVPQKFFRAAYQP